MGARKAHGDCAQLLTLKVGIDAVLPKQLEADRPTNWRRWRALHRWLKRSFVEGQRETKEEVPVEMAASQWPLDDSCREWSVGWVRARHPLRGQGWKKERLKSRLVRHQHSSDTVSTSAAAGRFHQHVSRSNGFCPVRWREPDRWSSETAMGGMAQSAQCWRSSQGTNSGPSHLSRFGSRRNGSGGAPNHPLLQATEITGHRQGAASQFVGCRRRVKGRDT